MCFGKPHTDSRAQIVADGAVRNKKLLTGRVNVSWSSRKGCRGAFGRQPARKSVFLSEFSQSGVVDMADLTKHICRVGTARIGYQGRVGQCVLNTTVKSGSGLGAVFAPTSNLFHIAVTGKFHRTVTENDYFIRWTVSKTL